jgi:neutral amino acid transport system ATP-binding protein
VTESLLTVNALEKRFGAVRAVDICTFDVAAGSITGLIGPNGAGKSTTIDLVTGIVRADAGTVMFDGHDITRRSPHAIASAGMTRTFQRARGWGRLTVMENLLVAAPAAGRESIWRTFVHPRQLARAEEADRARAREILTRLDLYALRNALVETLSGGQKRLLEFARIMMAAPKMVLLDEPVAGVNPVMADKLAGAIHELRNLGITVVLVEHNLRFVEQTCSTIIVMAAGKVIAEGTLADLQRDKSVVDAYLGEVSTSVA